MRELALRGHEVTYMSPFADKNPVKNYRDITIDGVAERMEEKKKEMNMFEMFNMPKMITPFIMGSMCLEITEMTLNSKNVQNLLHSNETFDLIIIEQFYNDAIRGLQYHFKAPTIIFSSVGPSTFVNGLVANPSPISYIPDMFLAYEEKHMTFCMRVENAIFHVVNELTTYFYTLPKHNTLLHKHFPDAPHLFDIIYDTPLILMNSHISTFRPVPVAPNMIDIGGYHVFPPKKLPENLQSYLDASKQGAILFSMGSNLKSKDMPAEKRDMFINAFKKLKLNVLWKWEDDTIPNKPNNVKIEKWLPQQDILPHPNIKLFITHGGLLSTTEAIYHGVPVIGIPIFGDQQTNMGLAKEGGYGLSLQYQYLTEEKLSETINEMLTNSKYTQNAKRRQKLMHDRPMSPIDTAMWWIEYVLRNPESDFYRSPALDLSWYQLYLIDVLLFLGFVTVIGIASFIFVCKKICCRKSKKNTSKDAKKKKTL